MTYRHRELAGGRWSELGFVEQMANIGSEVERALNWQAKNNDEYMHKAIERLIELIDLTLAELKEFPRLKELARMREAILDYFYGENEFKLTEQSLRKYFLHFAFAARANH